MTSSIDRSREGRHWIVATFTVRPSSESPNIGPPRAGSVTSIYARCAEVMFASVLRANPDSTRVLLSDVAGWPGDRLEADFVEWPFAHRPDPPIGSTFTAAIYLLDAMVFCLERLAEVDVVTFVDLDCLAVGSLAPIAEAARRTGIAAYPLAHSPSFDANGLSRIAAQSLHRELDGIDRLPVHYGGEIYSFTPTGLRAVLEQAERALEYARAAVARGDELRFRSQEHLLNYPLDRCGDVADLTPWVRRVWTGWQAPAIRSDACDESVRLWHVPAEKHRGMPALHEAMMNDESWFWAAEDAEFRRRAARALGIERTPRRWAGDAARKVRSRLPKTSRQDRRID